MSLEARACLTEQMDELDLDPLVYAVVLRDLARVNRWTLAARPTLAFLERAVAGRSAFRLLDVGCGQGDMLRRIARWARRRGIAAELVGVDQDPRGTAAARGATPAGMGIDFRTDDYQDVAGPFDCIISSLVAHHMTDEQLRHFICFMESTARAGWLINDLHRRRGALRLYPPLTRLLGVHRIVREDGMVSIARSFRAGDWHRIIREAGCAEGRAVVRPYFPYRLCVERLF